MGRKIPKNRRIFIYKTTNTINGKSYIGKHIGTDDDYYLGSGTLLLSKIEEYGRENFTREILKYCDASTSRLLEEKYIKEYGTLVPNGYNIHCKGGFGGGEEHTKNTLERISESQKRRWKEGKFPKKHTEETKEKIRQSRMGVKMTDEQIQRSLNTKKNWTEEQRESFRKKLKEDSLGFKWINDGNSRKQIWPARGDTLPDGWTYGWKI
jgi:group I intron endonuclease